MTALFEKMETRQIMLLLGGAALLICTALASALLIPQIQRYRTISSDRAALPPPADDAELAAMLGARDAEISALSRRLHGEMAGLPPREIESFVIDSLQSIAWRRDVTLQGVRPSTGETVDAFQELVFRLELSGDYYDLFAWLRDLHSELGFVVIKEYRMQRADQNNATPLLKVELTLASYRKAAT